MKRTAYTSRPGLQLFALLFILVSGSFCYSQDPPPPRLAKLQKGSVKVIASVRYGPSSWIEQASIAFDGTYAYLGTPNGLYRTSLPVTNRSVFELINFAGKTLVETYVHEGALYVLKNSPQLIGTPERSIVKSTDAGVTFTAVDAGLLSCFGKYCQYLVAEQAAFRGGDIFSNAGGGQNLLVSGDEGASWTPLIGSVTGQMCYHQTFEIIGSRVLVGGECPLDMAYIRAGTLRPDMRGWDQPPADVITPPLSNRMVQFIKHKPGTSDVYAGVELGLLKSTDLGHSFRWVVKYENGHIGPYIQEILYHSKISGLIVVGGFDKGPRATLYLAYSRDNGETWVDVSEHVQEIIGFPSSQRIFEVDDVDFIEEDPEGNILVGVRHPETRTLHIVRIDLGG